MCIFARCLSEVLEAKGKHIGSLHMVVVDSRRNPPLRIPPLQIMRLQQAAKGNCTISVTLNPAQLDAVRLKFNLDDEDMRQLKAALLAESGVRLLLDRIPTDRAVKIANGIYRMLLDTDTDTLDDFGVDFSDVRDLDDETLDELSEPLAVLEQQYHTELEPVARVYDEAVDWLNRAYAVNDAKRQHMYAGLASSLLTHTRKFLDSVTLPADAAPLRDAWNDYIEQTSLEVAQFLGSDTGQP